MQTSRCSGFPCCGAQALGIWASVVAARRLGAQRLWYTGLVAPQHVESSQTRDGTHVLCIDGWVLTHCAVREVQLLFCKLCLVEDFFFFAVPHGMQALSSPTRDRTRDPCSGSLET